MSQFTPPLYKILMTRTRNRQSRTVIITYIYNLICIPLILFAYSEFNLTPPTYKTSAHGLLLVSLSYLLLIGATALIELINSSSNQDRSEIGSRLFWVISFPFFLLVNYAMVMALTSSVVLLFDTQALFGRSEQLCLGWLSAVSFFTPGDALKDSTLFAVPEIKSAAGHAVYTAIYVIRGVTTSIIGWAMLQIAIKTAERA